MTSQPGLPLGTPLAQASRARVYLQAPWKCSHLPSKDWQWGSPEHLQTPASETKYAMPTDKHVTHWCIWCRYSHSSSTRQDSSLSVIKEEINIEELIYECGDNLDSWNQRLKSLPILTGESHDFTNMHVVVPWGCSLNRQISATERWGTICYALNWDETIKLDTHWVVHVVGRVTNTDLDVLITFSIGYREMAVEWLREASKRQSFQIRAVTYSHPYPSLLSIAQLSQ